VDDISLIAEDERSTRLKTELIFVGYVFKSYDLHLAVSVRSKRAPYVAWHMSHLY
jgi:hypothetical protein